MSIDEAAMESLHGESVEPSTSARKERACRQPSGGLRSPATRLMQSQPLDFALECNALALVEDKGCTDIEVAAPVVEAAVSRWQRLRQSVWAPLVLKTATACVGLVALALFGAYSMRGSAPGVPVTASGTEWLVGDGQQSDDHQHLVHQATPAALTSAGASESNTPGPSQPEKSSSEGTKESRAVPCTQQAKQDPQKQPGQGITADGRVILNVANADEFTRLPGVGQRRAEQIVALRTRLGKFKRVTDLLRVKGIGPKSLRKINPMVVLDPPPEVTEPQQEPES